MENWKEITPEELKDYYYNKQYSDNDIAELYGVSRTTVQKKRKEYGITFDM